MTRPHHRRTQVVFEPYADAFQRTPSDLLIERSRKASGAPALLDEFGIVLTGRHVSSVGELRNHPTQDPYGLLRRRLDADPRGEATTGLVPTHLVHLRCILVSEEFDCDLLLGLAH